MKEARGDRLTYEVARSRRSTVDIIVERDGSVLARAPQWADDRKIEEIVASRKHHIFRNLAEWRDLNATRVLREFKNGEGFPYLGRSYRLLLVSDQEEALNLRNGRFTLRRDFVEQGEEAARAAFRDYYIGRGLSWIHPRVASWAPKVGVKMASVDVRELGKRWASCSPNGRLTFHWKCVMAPPTIIDYIVVHELCHLHHRDHTDAFWNELDKVIPDYRERKEWLRKNGAGMDL